jgi:polyketide-type polyunsaturated fatty acid synthase PfaA
MERVQAESIAIIGVAGIFAKAANYREYWHNIIHKIDCITDVPPSRWNIEDYYDPDPKTPDKVYSKRGGFIPDIEFDPMEFGLPPNLLEVTDTSQLLGLVVARDVLEDAGYGADRSFNRDRVGVILGVAGGLKLITPLASRLQYPVWERVLESSGLSSDDTAKIVEKIKMAFVEWDENAFPGLLGNVIAGRIANRFDLGGINCVVDAACASSLSAVKMSVNQLLDGSVDMMLTGGVDTDNSPFTYMCFSKTPALTKGEYPRPFDADADGMMVGEGIGMVILKRLSDAERDGDRIYAIIRGIGASSDGRYKSIYAPRPEGQALALQRAYERAGIRPTTVDYIEAHGTGTKAGDPAEFAGLRQIFNKLNGEVRHIALGSVKSQIGHTKAAAGAAGLIKAAIALDQKVLPPTLHVDRVNPVFNIENTPIYINTETKPWIKASSIGPRRAGVSAFGFGGTNFHVILEEYQHEHDEAYRLDSVVHTLFLYADSPAQLRDKCRKILDELTDTKTHTLEKLSADSKAPEIPLNAARLGFVYETSEEACSLLEAAVKTLDARLQDTMWEHPKGITYQRSAQDPKGSLVALFPGQGSQYVNMGTDLTVNFPPLRTLYGQMDALFLEDNLTPLSSVVFPPPALDEEEEIMQSQALQATDYAQAAIGVFSAGLFNILARAGFSPDFTAGHSFGELTALWAGGVLTESSFLRLVKARGKAMAPPHDASFDAGGMLAVKGALTDIEQELENLVDVVIANLNSNSQVVLAGPTTAVKNAHQVLGEKGYKVTLLPVSAAFHTPLVGHASAPFAQAVEDTEFLTAQIPVYSNTTGLPYPDSTAETKALLANHILNPVYYKRQIENIYAAGGRIFVECGPRRITTNLVEDILAEKPYIAIALNSSRTKPADRQFREAVVKLRVAGVNLGDIDPYGL